MEAGAVLYRIVLYGTVLYYLLSGGSKGRRGPFDFALMFDESELFNGFESEPRRYGEIKSPRSQRGGVEVVDCRTAVEL